MSDFINEGDFETREAWLMTAIENFRPMFLEAVGEELPEKIRVSTGWTKRARKGSIGWTWISGAAEDKINNVFISPEISDSVEVLSVLLHELIHVWDDCEHGHTGAFKQAWAALGFTGKATCSTPGEELKDSLEAMTILMGDYPHAKMLTGADGGKGTMPKKQGTRMLKIICEASGGDYKVRMTRTNIEKYGLPTCPCHGEEMVEADA
ncbi:protease [Streptomyces phage Henoccus]|nr:protease [Streptomyces phage Henoccus]